MTWKVDIFRNFFYTVDTIKPVYLSLWSTYIVLGKLYNVYRRVYKNTLN